MAKKRTFNPDTDPHAVISWVGTEEYGHIYVTLSNIVTRGFVRPTIRASCQAGSKCSGKTW